MKYSISFICRRESMLKTFELQVLSMKQKGQERIKYQIGLSPLFQSHQAQLYIEQKFLLM